MRLHHRVDGAGPTVLLIGSLGSSLEMWQPQLPALLDRRVVRVDLPGHGGSPVPDHAFSIGDIGRCTLELAGERPAVCGLSLGGLVAMWIAAHAEVERVVLACTKPSFPPAEQWAARAAVVRHEGLGAIVEPVLARWFTPAADPALVGRAREMFLATSREGYARCCDALAEADLTDDLARIDAPVLAIGGAEDPSVTPDELEQLPGRRELIDGAAHLASVERPDAFNALLAEHLR